MMYCTVCTLVYVLCYGTISGASTVYSLLPPCRLHYSFLTSYFATQSGLSHSCQLDVLRPISSSWVIHPMEGQQ